MTYTEKCGLLVKLRNKYRSIPIKDWDTVEAKKELQKIHDLDKEIKGIDNSIGTTYNNSAYSNGDKILK